MVGQVTINGYDLFTKYGASLVKGTYTTLLQGLDAKDFVKNSSRTEDGDRIVITDEYPIKIKSREFSITFLVEGETRVLMIKNRNSLLHDMMTATKIKFNANKLGLGFNLVFRSMSGITDYNKSRYCTMSVTFYEPNPKDRINL